MLLFGRLEKGSTLFVSLVVTPSHNILHSHGLVVSNRIVIYVDFNLCITVKLCCLLELVNNVGISVLHFQRIIMMLLCNLAALKIGVWLHVLYALLFLCHFYHQSIELEWMRIENTSNAYFVANCWNYCSINLLATVRFYCISYVVSSDYKFNSFGRLHWRSQRKMMRAV